MSLSVKKGGMMIKKKSVTLILAILMVISFCKKDVKIIPNYLRKGTVEYHTNMGYKYMSLGSFDASAKQFQIALKKRPMFMRAVMGLGIVYLKQMKFKMSLQEFKKIIDKNPDNADAFNFIGIIHSEQGNYKLAKENFLVAANSKTYSNPENAFLNLAMLEMKQKRSDKALRYIEKGLIKNPEFVQLYNLRGNIYENKGFYKKAVSNYERALQLSRVKDISIKINVARGYIKMGQSDKALSLLENMLGDAPSTQVRRLILDMIKQIEDK